MSGHYGHSGLTPVDGPPYVELNRTSPAFFTVSRVKAPSGARHPLSVHSHGEYATRTVTEPGFGMFTTRLAPSELTTEPGRLTSGVASFTR